MTSEGIRSEKVSCLECPSDGLCDICKKQKLIFSNEVIQNVLMSSDQPNGCEVDIIESDEEAPVAEDLVDASEEVFAEN